MLTIVKLTVLFVLLSNCLIKAASSNSDDLIEKQQQPESEETVNLIDALKNAAILDDILYQFNKESTDEKFNDNGSMEKIKRDKILKKKKENSTVVKNSNGKAKAKANAKPGKHNVLTPADLERHRFVK